MVSLSSSPFFHRNLCKSNLRQMVVGSCYNGQQVSPQFIDKWSHTSISIDESVQNRININRLKVTLKKEPLINCPNWLFLLLLLGSQLCTCKDLQLVTDFTIDDLLYRKDGGSVYIYRVFVQKECFEGDSNSRYL